MILTASCIIAVTVIGFEYRPLKDTEGDAIIRNVNDTIIAAQVNSKEVSEVTLKLRRESRQSLHVVRLYSTRCNKLTSHTKSVSSSANFTVNGAIKILFPTYLVTGSQFHITGYILNASKITVEIQLYIFNSLDVASSFASNLENRVYQATIYISGPGVQNTSTIVNYTVPHTDYYFIVVDATDPILARFDITLQQEIYKHTDYKETCVIEDTKECAVSYKHFSFNDKQECILAHTDYVRDVAWAPVDVQVTTHPRKNTATAIAAMSSVGVFCVLIVFSVTTFCGFYYWCKSGYSQRKYGN